MTIGTKNIKENLKNLKTLYVEDEISLQTITAKMLEKLFLKVDVASNGKEGLELYNENEYDLVITDINMPILDGIEMSQLILEDNPYQAIIFTTAYTDSKKLLKAISLGIDGYIIKPLTITQLFSTLDKVSISIKNHKENQFYKEHLEKTIEEKVNYNLRLQKEKYKNYEDTILALVNMVEIRDSYTSGHSQRVAIYSKMIANELNLSEDEQDYIYKAGILHDIGKIAIPDSILLKPDKLDESEFNLMKKHATMSYEILKKIPMYKDLAIYVKHHHERYDGSGYPDGLKKDEIPLFSQIMSICDTFDAMTTSRIYKPSKSKQNALEELEKLKNITFSSNIVDAAVKVLKDVHINSQINQNPHSEFEEQRFSFFYKDKLTALYNSDYLDLVLNKNTYLDNYANMTVILLHNFGNYNKINNWEKGDKILKDFAIYLKENFNNDSLIFRFRGDDFVILSEDSYMQIDTSKLQNEQISIETIEIDLKKEDVSSYSKLKHFLDDK